ncbi:hypothetical protein IFR04_009118 [Cadophora malorum]|uniref:Alpha/beta hydrolase fold-3 domain-containing protein n=1 Tax=Cadophora malorum TaxID=108018 RepID=A0A8H7WAD2_9HELO|nr:hypothetical protein IFR04_009118 [Cadophora malorum]
MNKVTTISSIRVDRREGRSIANAAAQKIINPFSSLILKPGKPQPRGSPQLTPPSKTQGDCSIEESQIANTWLYTFKTLSKSGRAEARHRIYYFAGGGFRDLPEKEHWKLCSDLSSMLPDYEISLVSYPLVPNSPASTALPHLERLCDALVEQAKSEGFRVTFFGDSSGGNIAIVLGLYVATQYLKNTSDGPCPVEAVMAMCPATDMRNENPGIDVVEAHDPILSRKVITEVAEGWRAELPASDP